MKKILLFLFFSTFAFAQVKLCVLDSVTKKPVSYASVWKENNLFASTDSLGFFYKNNENNQIYKITAIGYDEKVINEVSDTLFLQPKYYNLESVLVKKPTYKNKVQYGKAKKGIIFGVQFDSKTAEFVKFIPNVSEDNNLFINSIAFYSLTYVNNRKVKIVVYNVTENGSPNEMILQETIICNLKKGATLNKVDLSKYNLMLPQNGIFIGIQYLLIEENKNYQYINNREVFHYEPFLFATDNPEVLDSWYYNDGIWGKNNRFSFNLKVNFSD